MCTWSAKGKLNVWKGKKGHLSNCKRRVGDCRPLLPVTHKEKHTEHATKLQDLRQKINVHFTNTPKLNSNNNKNILKKGSVKEKISYTNKIREG